MRSIKTGAQGGILEVNVCGGWPEGSEYAWGASGWSRLTNEGNIFIHQLTVRLMIIFYSELRLATQKYLLILFIFTNRILILEIN